MVTTKVARLRLMHPGRAAIGFCTALVFVFAILPLFIAHANAATPAQEGADRKAQEGADRKAQEAVVALARGDVEEFRRLISEPEDANRLAWGSPLTYFAIQYHSKEALGHLLALGANPSARVQGITPVLVIAITSQFPEGAKELIEAGADVNARHRGDGPWPLSFAIGANDTGLVRLLTENGADVTLTESSTGTTALHMAVRRENKEMIRILVEAGADPDAANKFGQTPRDAAKIFGIEESLNMTGRDGNGDL